MRFTRVIYIITIESVSQTELYQCQFESRESIISVHCKSVDIVVIDPDEQ